MTATIQSGIQGLSPGQAGGISTALNLTAAQVVKPTKGIATRLNCIAAGSIVLNDCATVGAAALTNEFFSQAMAVGAVVELAWPCGAGIVASAVSGTFSLAFS